MTRRFISYFILTTIAAVAFAGASSRPVLSASSIVNDVNSIGKKVEQLIIIRDRDSLSSAEKTAQESRIQQDILNDVVDLSMKEISNVKDKLNSLPDFDKDSPEQKLRGGYLNELDAYNAYFEAKKQDISDAANIDDLKTVASDIKTYRASMYNNEIQNMVTFTLLYYDQDIINMAKTRLGKMNTDISKLQDFGFLKKGFSQSSVNKAANLLDDAAKLHDQAKTLILTPPQTTTDNATADAAPDNTNAAADATGVIDNKNIITSLPTPRDLIEKSIGNIKSAYNIFIQIGKDVRKALGLK